MPAPLWDKPNTLWLSVSERLGASRPDGPIPDFLTICPARTGTTWLEHQLRKNPGIYIPPEKELRYFETRWRFDGLGWYQDQFLPGRDRLKGELTPSYALLPAPMIQAIHDLNPRIKLIFLARRLPERAWSHARHVYEYFESTFRTRSAPLEKMSQSDLMTCFLSDYLLTSADYVGILRRWLRVFPKDQFYVRYFEDAFADPQAYLCGLEEFLGVEAHGERTGLEVRINEGLNTDLPSWAGDFLERLFSDSHRRAEVFFKETFGLDPVWQPSQPLPKEEALWIQDEPPAWRITLRDGVFHAAALGGTRHLTSPLLGDLRIQIDRANGKAVEVPGLSTDEDVLLATVLADQDFDYDNNRVIECGVFRGFSIIRWKGRFWGIRQSMGRFDLAAALRESYSPQDVLMSGSRLELESRIDALEARSLIDGVVGRIAVESSTTELRTALDAANADLKQKDADLAALQAAPFVGFTKSYSIWRNVRKFFAIPHSAAWLGGLNGELPDIPGVITADSVQTLENVLGDSVAQAPVLIQSHRQFNIVGYGPNVYGLKQSLGDLDVTAVTPDGWREYFDRGDAVRGQTAEHVRLKIDGLELRSLQNRVTDIERDLTGMREDNQRLRDMQQAAEAKNLELERTLSAQRGRLHELTRSIANKDQVKAVLLKDLDQRQVKIEELERFLAELPPEAVSGFHQLKKELTDEATHRSRLERELDALHVEIRMLKSKLEKTEITLELSRLP